MPKNQEFGYRVIVIKVQVLGKYMKIGYLDPWGCVCRLS